MIAPEPPEPDRARAIARGSGARTAHTGGVGATYPQAVDIPDTPSSHPVVAEMYPEGCVCRWTSTVPAEWRLTGWNSSCPLNGDAA